MKPMMLVALMIFTLSTSFAQEGRVRRGDPRPSHGTAQLFITPMPGQIPSSIKELSDSSLIILDGIVRETLPSRETSPQTLETDAVIAISRVLKGPEVLREVVISQRGGTRDRLVVMPAQYALVKPGERYVLFLTEDKRPNIPAVTGRNRYLVTGIWSGLFYFQEGRMRTNALTLDSLRSKYEGVSVEEVVSEIRAALRR